MNRHTIASDLRTWSYSSERTMHECPADEHIHSARKVVYHDQAITRRAHSTTHPYR